MQFTIYTLVPRYSNSGFPFDDKEVRYVRVGDYFDDGEDHCYVLENNSQTKTLTYLNFNDKQIGTFTYDELWLRDLFCWDNFLLESKSSDTIAKLFGVSQPKYFSAENRTGNPEWNNIMFCEV